MDGGRKATYRNGNGSSSRNSAGGGPGDAGSHRGRNPTVAGECRAVSSDCIARVHSSLCDGDGNATHGQSHKGTISGHSTGTARRKLVEGHTGWTYSVKKGKTIRKGDELLVVYGSYYWQELRRGMGCTQTQCAHNCPFRVNDDETEPAMGDWVQNGVVHREEDGQPTHDTGDVAESAQQSEGQLEQNTRCHNPPHILGRNKWAYASNVLVGKSWMGGLVAAKDIPAGVMIVRYSGKETDLGTEVDSEYLMVATSTKDRFERSW